MKMKTYILLASFVLAFVGPSFAQTVPPTLADTPGWTKEVPPDEPFMTPPQWLVVRFDTDLPNVQVVTVSTIHRLKSLPGDAVGFSPSCSDGSSGAVSAFNNVRKTSRCGNPSQLPRRIWVPLDVCAATEISAQVERHGESYCGVPDADASEKADRHKERSEVS
jgi:hypothetical protein